MTLLLFSVYSFICYLILYLSCNSNFKSRLILYYSNSGLQTSWLVEISLNTIERAQNQEQAY